MAGLWETPRGAPPVTRPAKVVSNRCAHDVL
jgi:hypothetical protein